MKKLAEIRDKKDISHQKLADMAGVSRPTISYLENQKRTPTILTCLRICRALDVKLSDILKDIGE